MPDIYANFAALAAAEPGRNYAISSRNTGSSVVVAAPHGGGIEPGTSEIALSIAGTDLSYYIFEGKKATGNRALHITSSSFDEPRCLALLSDASIVLTVHGEDSETEVVYLGGLHTAIQASLRTALESNGYEVSEHSDPLLQGIHNRNICNIGLAGRGVQLELTVGLRKSMFESLDRSGRRRPKPRLYHFSGIIRAALAQARLGQ